LVPKKAKDFKKSTAEDLTLPEELVSDLINFYWAKVRNHISNLEYEAIEITNLGTFKVKNWIIDETIVKYKQYIDRMHGKFSEHIVKKELEERMQKLEKIKSLVEEREIKFKEIRDARKNKNNLEEQGPDTSGPPEQDL